MIRRKRPGGMYFDPAQIPTSLMEPSNEAGQSGGIVTTPLHGPDAVRRALERRDLKFGLSVDEAMVIVGPVLDERDTKIEALTDRLSEAAIQLRDENDRILELIAENRRLRVLAAKDGSEEAG